MIECCEILPEGSSVVADTCAVEGCDRPRRARGWCMAHYGRWRKTGDVRSNEPIAKRFRSPLERFWGRVEQVGPDLCWEWQGALSGGYGTIVSHGGLTVYTHRFAYELLVGPIPEGLQVDHLCRNRACGNPGHLELVTRVVNILRGASPPARNARQTHCKRGHEFTPENTYRRPDGSGWRGCKKCIRARNASRYRVDINGGT